MKKVEAYIRSSCFDRVKNALDKVDFVFFVFEDIQGAGDESRQRTAYRGQEHSLVSIPRTKLAVFVEDDKVQEVVGIIRDNSKTGDSGDGKIFIIPVEEAISIRTGREI